MHKNGLLTSIWIWAILAGALTAGAADIPVDTTAIEGYLYAKLDAIGTKSEGPVYYLQPLSGPDVSLPKVSALWEPDPILHPLLGHIVRITPNPGGLDAGYKVEDLGSYTPANYFAMDFEPGGLTEEVFSGFLFARLGARGSMSEGPEYFLQRWDGTEVHVIKQVVPWQPDPELAKHLWSNVDIRGSLDALGIFYKAVKPYNAGTEKGAVLEDVFIGPGLEFKLALVPKGLMLDNKPPAGPTPAGSLGLTLLVRNPYRTAFVGSCPTSQTYDFAIKRGSITVWRWSDSQSFLAVVTPVTIPCSPDFIEFAKVVWEPPNGSITEAGLYTAWAMFAASGEEVSEPFEIDIVW